MTRFRLAVLVLAGAAVFGGYLPTSAGPLPFATGGGSPGGQGWRTEADMLDPVVDSSAEEINGVVYVVGGIDNIDVTAVLQSYDPSTNSWTNRAPLLQSRYQSDGASVIDGKLYVPGGWNGAFPTNTLYVYDPTIDAWTSKAPMPHLAACGVSGAIDGKLYVTTACNGFSTPKYAQNLDVYDPRTDTWTVLALSNVAHSQPPGAVVNGKLYVAGGQNTSGVTGTTEVYDPAKKVWTTLRSMPHPVLGPASVELDGKLWVFGGVNGTTYESIVQVYDPVTNDWKTWKPPSKLALPAASAYSVAAVADGIPFLAGGGSGTGILGTTYGLFVLPTVP